MSRVACLIVVSLAVGSSRGADEPPPGFAVRSMRGFTVLVHDEVTWQPPDRWGRWPLDVLEREFEDLRRILSPRLFELVRTVPVWVRWQKPDREPRDVLARYHAYAGPELRRMGRSVAMANSIELVSLKRLGELRPPGSRFQQIVLLHELAHAVHHRLLGFDSAEVKSAYQMAVDRKLYDMVSDRAGRLGRAYARTNDREYFAELSCAYLDSCFYFPFTYSDLKAHDPAGFALMEAVWKKPEQFAGRAAAVPTPEFRVAARPAAAAPPAAVVDVGSEQRAFALLDAARGQARAGRGDDAKRTLDDLLARFPQSLAAADARRLRATLP
jgi:hypothetical protein